MAVKEHTLSVCNIDKVAKPLGGYMASKKNLIGKQWVFTLCFLLSCVMQLAAQTEDDFDYEQNRDGGITITSYLGSGIKDIVIPAKIKGINVTEIGINVFPQYKYIDGMQFLDKNKKIDSITIPTTVTKIGAGAFRDCGISKITIPNGVISIGMFAFMGNNLTEIVIPDSVTTMGHFAFAWNKITKITLSNKMKTIPTGAFYHNSIRSLIIPEGITSIESRLENIWAYEKYVDDETSVIIEHLEYSAGAFGENELLYIKLPATLKTGKWVDFSGNPLVLVDNSYCVMFSGSKTITGIKIGANASKDSYEETFYNFYTSQGKKAGVYIKDGKIWKVGTQADFDKLVADAEKGPIFPDDFQGITWIRSQYTNTLTFTENTLKSSSQNFFWKLQSVSGDAYTYRASNNSNNTPTITIKPVNGNLEISGDSGSGENNWNGTWRNSELVKKEREAAELARTTVAFASWLERFFNLKEFKKLDKNQFAEFVSLYREFNSLKLQKLDAALIQLKQQNVNSNVLGLQNIDSIKQLMSSFIQDKLSGGQRKDFNKQFGTNY
jgi:hypothetical protein